MSEKNEDFISSYDEGIDLEHQDAIYAIIGAPRSGKSTLIKALIYQLSKDKFFKHGICFTTTKFSGLYDYLPNKYVFEGFDEKFLKRYLDRLKELKTQDKLQHNFLIVDDCVGNLVSSSSMLFQNLISTHRHYKMSIIISTQYLMAGNISTLLREVYSYAFMFSSKQKRSIIALYESFGYLCRDPQNPTSTNASIKAFFEMFEEATNEKYHCLVSKNVGKDEYDKAFRSFQAPLVDDFHLKY